MSSEIRIKCHECETPNAAGTLFCARCGASLRTPVSPDPYPARRRITPRSAAVGAALFVILAVAVATLGTIVYRTTVAKERAIDPLAGHPATTATTSATLAQGSGGEGSSAATEISGVLLRPQSVSSSSALKATATQSHRATNLVDGDRTTAWNEGVAGPGIGEWVRFDFSTPVTLVRIEIANGNQKDGASFEKDAMVRSLELQYSDGSSQLIDLLDTKSVQGVTIESKRTEWLKLTILSVYPDYEEDHAALSAVRIFAVAAQ